jgi:hypothetical protein
MKKYLFYKHQVAGPFKEISDSLKLAFKKMIDNKLTPILEPTPYPNENMKNAPNDVHEFEK